MRKYLIVGVDPGHTIGLCATDFEGRAIECKSLEDAGIESAVSHIESMGTPSVIATDVNPAPQFVLRLASYFNARIFVPRKSFREDFKRRLLKVQQKKANKKLAKNNHERDAFAASLMGWREYQNTIRSALLEDVPNVQKFTHLILQGYRKEAAIEELKMPQIAEPKKLVRVEAPQKSKQKKSERAAELERRNISLLRRIEILEQQNVHLKQKLNSHKRGVASRLSENREFRRLKTKIARLEQRLRDVQKRRFAKPKAKKQEQKQNSLSNKKSQKKPAQSLKRLNSFDNLVRIVGDYRQTRKNNE